jgi:predicted TIM-barrel fold metal-dependent hydrolase
MNRNLPNLSCDCHTHVFGPKGQYPYALARQYTPEDASIEALLALGTSIGTQRVVIVQPSPYGADNRCTVDALIRINAQNQAADHGVQGDKARGIAVIDEATTDKSLQAMHAAGVRGIRLNLETSGVSDPAYAEQLFRWSAGRVAHLYWH